MPNIFFVRSGDPQCRPGWYYEFEDDPNGRVGPFPNEAAAREDSKMYGWPYNGEPQ